MAKWKEVKDFSELEGAEVFLRESCDYGEKVCHYAGRIYRRGFGIDNFGLDSAHGTMGLSPEVCTYHYLRISDIKFR